MCKICCFRLGPSYTSSAAGKERLNTSRSRSDHLKETPDVEKIQDFILILQGGKCHSRQKSSSRRYSHHPPETAEARGPLSFSCAPCKLPEKELWEGLRSTDTLCDTPADEAVHRALKATGSCMHGVGTAR